LTDILHHFRENPEPFLRVLESLGCQNVRDEMIGSAYDTLEETFRVFISVS
jgi:hypothetical protein